MNNFENEFKEKEKDMINYFTYQVNALKVDKSKQYSIQFLT